MHKLKIALVISALISAPVFADDAMDDSKVCGSLVTACKDAGYTEAQSTDKNFWLNCMRPLLLNKTVDGVTLDAKTVKECRKDKIKQLKAEINDLKNAK